MQRRRKQSGCIVKIGGMWCVRYADWRVEDGVRIRKQGLSRKLCAVQDSEVRLKRPPDYVKDLAEEFMDGVNDTMVRPQMSATITEFVEGNWLRHVEAHLAASTLAAYKFYWHHHLKPRCGSELIRDYTTPQAEAVLEEISRHHPDMHQATLNKLRNMLSAIFKRACAQGVRNKKENPIREVTTPRGLPAETTHAYTIEEIRRILGAVEDETTRVIISVAAYAGLAKSELQGLTWESYSDGELAVVSNVVCGLRGETKTVARKDSVPLIAPARTLLDLYKLRLGNPTKGPIFATTIDTPLDLQNVARRKIIPILEACQECGEEKADHRTADHEFSRRQDLPRWHGWHAFRRGCGSNLYDLGVSDKLIQKILRHSNVATTLKYYVKTRKDSERAALAQLEAAVEANRQAAMLEAEKSPTIN